MRALLGFLLVAACGHARPTRLEILSAAELVTSASSEHSEIRLAVSPDGKTMLWGSTNRPGGAGGWDIWVSRRTAEGWSAPEPAPFNSGANDFDPAFTPDGRWVWFFSNRESGEGGDDLYRVGVERSGFGAAENLGPSVNSSGNEWAPAISPNGRTLLFATDGRGGRGRHDLFVASLDGDRVGEVKPLGGAINTAADEFDATFLADGASLVFSRSTNVETDPISLYFSARMKDGYDAGTLLPASANVTGGYTLGPALDWKDPNVLYFSGKRAEAAAGGMDLYRVTIKVAR
jgi:Tol biopolymer transport system component